MKLHHVQAEWYPVTRVETPSTVDEALTLLDAHHATARLVAGGTDLLLELRRGVRPGIDTLIDLTRIAGLDDIQEAAGGFEIGPTTTHAQIAAHEGMRRQAIPLAQACREIGSPQLRNRATVAGNLVTASPANDTITPLRALDAEVDLTSTAGTRTVSLADFHTGVRRSLLEPNEMVTAIRFRALGPSERSVFLKLGNRRAQAISIIHLTALVEVEDGLVVSARLLAGSVAPTIVELREAAASLIGAPLDGASIERAARIAASSIKPIDDVRATAGYRSDAMGTVVTRALGHLARDVPFEAPPPVLLGGGRRAVGRPSVSHTDSESVTSVINGRRVVASGAAGKTLLDWLREEAGPSAGLSLTGTKEGCAEGECGACTIWLDGTAVMSCLVPATRAHGSEIVTIEGLGSNGELHSLQQAFIDRAAVQCGFCIPGFLMAGASLLAEVPSPDLTQIEEALSGNLCRCTGYYKIIEALEQAAGA